MATYRTALGKTVDMSALAGKNEMTRAVGNMSVNARGDQIDSKGRVIRSVTEAVTDKYAKTVGQASAKPRSGSVEPDSVRSSIDLSQLNAIERELETSQDDLEVEAIKAAELKKLRTKK